MSRFDAGLGIHGGSQSLPDAEVLAKWRSLVTAYAVAHLHRVNLGPEIVEYLRKIDATLAPFGGRFLIHGGDKTVLEGSWPGDLIVIGFPDRSRAQAWYESADYRSILELRTGHADGNVILVDGVSDDHRATDILDGSG